MIRPLALITLALAASCSEPAGPAAMVEMPARAGFENTGPYPGFTLFAPLDSRRVILADMAGEEVHHWDTPLKPGDSCYLTDRGTVLACQRYGDDPLFQDAGATAGRSSSWATTARSCGPSTGTGSTALSTTTWRSCPTGTCSS